ncbi:hypothetical protein Trydic_g5368 [Trypoxylus dichotomus]
MPRDVWSIAGHRAQRAIQACAQGRHTLSGYRRNAPANSESVKTAERVTVSAAARVALFQVFHVARRVSQASEERGIVPGGFAWASCGIELAALRFCLILRSKERKIRVIFFLFFNDSFGSGGEVKMTNHKRDEVARAAIGDGVIVIHDPEGERRPPGRSRASA